MTAEHAGWICMAGMVIGAASIVIDIASRRVARVGAGVGLGAGLALVTLGVILRLMV